LAVAGICSSYAQVCIQDLSGKYNNLYLDS
jgi:hypothetical protein